MTKILDFSLRENTKTKCIIHPITPHKIAVKTNDTHVFGFNVFAIKVKLIVIQTQEIIVLKSVG